MRICILVLISHLNNVRIKIVTAVYVLILAGIVVLADFRGTQYLLNFVGGVPFGDKIGHFVLMGTFSFLLNLTFGAKMYKVWKVNFLLGSLIVLTLVTLEEFSQIFVAGRSFGATDLIFDCAGIFIFGRAARFVCRKTEKN
jgi:hypothetical protein